MPELNGIKDLAVNLVESFAYLGIAGLGFYAAKEVLVAIFSLL